ncbi:MAG: hypothetical protein QM779_11830 [Propionicimonas sp.]|uniref:hypothetical protein n=1 Tax=Propionicimonas sp. TaxID=1955623 RepID=UPI003D0F9DD9
MSCWPAVVPARRRPAARRAGPSLVELLAGRVLLAVVLGRVPPVVELAVVLGRVRPSSASVVVLAGRRPRPASVVVELLAAPSSSSWPSSSRRSSCWPSSSWPGVRPASSWPGVRPSSSCWPGELAVVPPVVVLLAGRVLLLARRAGRCPRPRPAVVLLAGRRPRPSSSCCPSSWPVPRRAAGRPRPAGRRPRPRPARRRAGRCPRSRPARRRPRPRPSVVRVRRRPRWPASSAGVRRRRAAGRPVVVELAVVLLPVELAGVVELLAGVHARATPPDPGKTSTRSSPGSAPRRSNTHRIKTAGLAPITRAGSVVRTPGR